MGLFDRDVSREAAGVPTGPGLGDMPASAQSRLSHARASGLFTSTLSAKEFALSTSLGPVPVAQVLGASVYQVGWQSLPSQAQWAGDDFSFPLMMINGAWGEARRLACDRLRAEARAVGAHAVVGVSLRRGEHDWGRGSVEFVVSGTAVRLPDLSPAVDRPPALSDLSVQDYWKLHTLGCGPAGIVATTSTMFVSQGQSTRWRRRRQVTSNQELHEYSEGFSNARRIAVYDLRDQARAAGADGVVGVSFQYDMTTRELAVDQRYRPDTGVHVAPMAVGVTMPPGGGGADKRDGVVFTVHAAGTAIRRGERIGVREPGTTVTLDLNDR
jgi:uncharacterized protein YbjQ (UPF0145 family)